MRKRFAIAFVLAIGATTALALANCHVVRGTRVTLFGGADDPDVLVWDSRGRLVDYAAGSADTRKFLLPHALLNRPGTKAVVQACVSSAVHSKFSSSSGDAIGILILSGDYRGRYGWVDSADLHGPGISQDDDQW